MDSTASEAPGRAQLHVYDTTTGFRWSAVAANGERLGSSDQAYTHRGDCVHGFNLLRAAGTEVDYQFGSDVDAECARGHQDCEVYVL